MECSEVPNTFLTPNSVPTMTMVATMLTMMSVSTVLTCDNDLDRYVGCLVPRKSRTDRQTDMDSVHRSRLKHEDLKMNNNRENWPNRHDSKDYI